MTIEEYLEEAIASFVRDPADTLFQKGYLAALEETQKFLLQQKKSD
jgi:7-keto-8-aminopelargonate synthetase-like enzyme